MTLLHKKNSKVSALGPPEPIRRMGVNQCADIKKLVDIVIMEFDLRHPHATRNAILEQIEDEFDLNLLKQAVAYNEEHPETYTHEEMKQRLFSR